MVDDDKKLPKKFDTTSRLNLEDTFDEDEITLVDEIVDPDAVPEKKRREESITEKLPNAKARLTQVKSPMTAEKIPVAPKPQKPPVHLSDLLKKINLSAKAKRTIFIGLVTIPVLVGLIFLSNSPKTDPTKAESRTIPLELSKVEFMGLDGEKIDDKNIPVNTYFIMKFYALSWDARADEKLDLKADIRVYSHKNQLLVFKPEYAKFLQSADMKQDKVLIQTKLRFSDKSDLGFYRIFITVKENTTQRQNSVQSRIRVVGKK